MVEKAKELEFVVNKTGIHYENAFGLDKSKIQLVGQLVEAYGYDRAVNSLAKMSGYVDTPPTIDQFLHDPHFLGNITGFDPELGRDRLYPAWKKVLGQVFPNPFYSPYNEVIFSGSIGLI